MKTKSAFTLILLILLLLFSACTAKPAINDPAIPEPDPVTPTPDPCTGWTCTLEGVVYLDTAAPGNEISRVPIDFLQVSNCSSTRGEYRAVSGEDGHFYFEVFLHDTDSFVFEVNAEGYQPARVIIGGFDCLYCACDPVEILLKPVE